MNHESQDFTTAELVHALDSKWNIEEFKQELFKELMGRLDKDPSVLQIIADNHWSGKLAKGLRNHGNSGTHTVGSSPSDYYNWLAAGSRMAG